MSRLACAFVTILVVAAGCAGRSADSPSASPDETPARGFGALVMAHGGTPEWNDAILAAVKPLRGQVPIEVAFGMADAATLQQAVTRLEAEGVDRIGVVRLFISGESWYERTEQILGLRPGAPQRPDREPRFGDDSGDGGHGGHGGHHQSGNFWSVETHSSFALTKHGLAEAEAMGTVLADRARSLSREPIREDVLILAHGPGNDAENDRWMGWLDARAESVRQALPFRGVKVMTLREDWPDKRPAAERRIRSFVEAAHDDGVTPIVIPFRVYGFGAYGDVLKGLDYVADRQGLVPHDDVGRWIWEQIERLQQGTFRAPATSRITSQTPKRDTLASTGGTS